MRIEFIIVSLILFLIVLAAALSFFGLVPNIGEFIDSFLERV